MLARHDQTGEIWRDKELATLVENITALARAMRIR